MGTCLFFWSDEQRLRLKWLSEADLLLFLMGTLKCHLSEHWAQTFIRVGALSCENAGNMGGIQRMINLDLLEADSAIYLKLFLPPLLGLGLS